MQSKIKVEKRFSRNTKETLKNIRFDNFLDYLFIEFKEWE